MVVHAFPPIQLHWPQVEEDQRHRNLPAITSLTTFFFFEFPSIPFPLVPLVAKYLLCLGHLPSHKGLRIFHLQLAGRMSYVIPTSPAVFRAVVHDITSFSSELIHITYSTSLLHKLLSRHFSRLKASCAETDRHTCEMENTPSAKENLLWQPHLPW